MKEQPLDPRATDDEYKAKRDTLRHAAEFQVRVRDRGVEFPYGELEIFCLGQEIHRSPEECSAKYTELKHAANAEAKIIEEKRFKENLISDLRETKEVADEARIAAEQAWEESRKARIENQSLHRRRSTLPTTGGSVEIGGPASRIHIFDD